jgi:type I restriction enzyme R subunit
MYLDKSIKDHNVQAVCRTNRLFLVNVWQESDYFGVFDDAAKALEFDEESVKKSLPT